MSDPLFAGKATALKFSFLGTIETKKGKRTYVG